MKANITSIMDLDLVNLKDHRVLEAELRKGRGRIHILGVEIDGKKTYLDFTTTLQFT